MARKKETTVAPENPAVATPGEIAPMASAEETKPDKYDVILQVCSVAGSYKTKAEAMVAVADLKKRYNATNALPKISADLIVSIQT